MKQYEKVVGIVDLGVASVVTRGAGQVQIDVSTGRLNFPAGFLED